MEKVKDFFKKIHYNSPVTLTFTIISLFVLLLGMLTGDYTTRLLFSVYRGSFSDPLFYLRLFGHVLGHSGWDHFFNNFLLILLLGPNLEEKYGSKNMIILIIFTAFITGILSVALFETGLYGASGIVFMMILLSSYANYQEGRIPLTLILVIVSFIGKEIFDGMFSNDNISHITHIAGGACGGITGYFLNKKPRIKNIDEV